MDEFDALAAEVMAEWQIPGLPRHDWVHMGGHLDNAGMLAALRRLEPSKPFRSAYQAQSATLRCVEFRRVRGQPPRAGWVRAALVFSQA
ncbi:MAG TPA: hypothetical protein VF924_03005 [Stellaceae bacterium]